MRLEEEFAKKMIEEEKEKVARYIRDIKQKKDSSRQPSRADLQAHLKWYMELNHMHDAVSGKQGKAETFHSSSAGESGLDLGETNGSMRNTLNSEGKLGSTALSMRSMHGSCERLDDVDRKKKPLFLRLEEEFSQKKAQEEKEKVLNIS